MLMLSRVGYTSFKDFWPRDRRKKVLDGSTFTKGLGKRQINVPPAMYQDMGQPSPRKRSAPKGIQKAVSFHAPT